MQSEDGERGVLIGRVDTDRHRSRQIHVRAALHEEDGAHCEGHHQKSDQERLNKLIFHETSRTMCTS